MGRPKGGEKAGGRAKGTPNKVSKEIKEKIKIFIEGNFDDFTKMWKDIPNSNPVKYNTFLALLRFVVPPATAEIETDDKERQSAIQKSINDLNNIGNGKSD